MSQIEFRVSQTLATEHQVLLFWFMEHQEKSVLTGWSGGFNPPNIFGLLNIKCFIAGSDTF